MTTRNLFSAPLLMATLLLAAPALIAQDAPPPPANGQPGPPPMSRMHKDKDKDKGKDKGKDSRHDGDHGPGSDMRGPGGRLLPPGTWWRNPEVVQALTLTPDQVKRIDEQFLHSREQLIDMHASLEKEQLQLEPLLSANPVDQGKALAQISKIADKRAELEKTDARMLLGIRSVLTADQWTKLHDRGPGDRDRHADGSGKNRQSRPGSGQQQAPPPPAQ